MISETLLLLSSGLLGIFLGAQITEAILFVPYWKDLPPNDFFELYKAYGRKIYKFFAPLTILATILPLVTVIYHLINQSNGRIFLMLMGVSTLIFFSTYFLYFKKANKSFAERSIPNSKLTGELVKWGNWHWGRIFFECIAFCISLFLLLTI